SHFYSIFIPQTSLMQIRLLITAFIICIAYNASAQLHDNAFRSADNPQYWQNRMPDKDYWQQDVYYRINAVMHEEDNRVSATEELTYWNNSPDTLRYVYFHLY